MMSDPKTTDSIGQNPLDCPGDPLGGLVGQTLGTYRIIGAVGQGSMGVVFEAIQENLNRKVALKVLPPTLTTRERTIQRFLREAESVAKLRHENIVDIYDIGHERGLYYYAMRFVEGAPLDRLLRERSFRPMEAARIIRQASQAIHFAHEHGIIHRDIKPGNLILTPEGNVVITDFGLARPEKSSSLTESGALVGTPMYMSPEQVRGDRRALDRRTDVYSLGASLYELATGKPPFDGKTTQETLQRILEIEPRPPRRIRSQIPGELEIIMLKAMEKEADRRYATGGDLAEDLRRFIDREPILARRASTITRTFKWVRKHRNVAAVVTIVLVLALCGITLAVMQSRQQARISRFGALIRQAEDLMRSKHLDGAVNMYEQARSYGPRSPKSYAGLGLAYYQQAILAEAEGGQENTESAGHFLEQALHALDEAMRLETRDGRVPVTRAKIHMRTESGSSPSEWLDDIETAAKMDPYNFEVQHDVASLYLAICQNQELASDQEIDLLEKAERWATQAVETNPRSAEARVTRCLIRMSLYDLAGHEPDSGLLPAVDYLDLARQDAAEALRLDRNNRTAYELRQAISSELAAKDWRSVLLQKGLNLVGDEPWIKQVHIPDSIPTYLFPGFVALSGAGQSTDNKTTERAAAEQLLAKGRRLERQGDRQGALAQYLEAVRLCEDIAEGHRRLAEVYLHMQGDDAAYQAFAHARHAENLAPDDIRCIRTYREAARKVGNTEEANRLTLKLAGMGEVDT